MMRASIVRAIAWARRQLERPLPRTSRLVIGLGIGAEGVRAVGVTGTRVRWAVEVEREPAEPLGDALAELIARCPLRRWRRPVVRAAIGPAAVQLKRLVGLPPVRDPAQLAAVVRESTSRFFLQNGVPLITSGVCAEEAGTTWAAAFDAPVVREVDRACRAARLRVAAVVPTAAALRFAVGEGAANDALVWLDGDVEIEIATEHGVLHAVRRRPPSGAQRAPVAAVQLAVLGEQAARFADAYGAAQMPRRDALAWSARRIAPTPPPPRARMIAAALACVVAGTGALAAPGLIALHAARRATAQLARIDIASRRAAGAERDLVRVTSALQEIAEFEVSRRPATLLLRDLTRALPPGSALVELQLDGAGGTVVALAPHAGTVVNALERVPGVASPEIVGPVTREATSATADATAAASTIAPPGAGVGSAGTSVELDRVTVHFRLIPPSRSSHP